MTATVVALGFIAAGIIAYALWLDRPVKFSVKLPGGGISLEAGNRPKEQRGRKGN